MNREAKIECIVLRPFFYNGKKYNKDNIFFLNPNNEQQRAYLRYGIVYEISEENYNYILCTKAPKNISGIIYNYNDIIDVSKLDMKKRLLFIKRGWFKKVIKKNKISNNKEISNKNNKEVINKTYKIGDIAKTLSRSSTEIKKIIKDKLNININSYNKIFSKEEYEKILLYIKENEIK